MKRSILLPSPRQTGFSIAEVLVGAVLLAVAIVGAAALLVSGTTTRNSTTRNDQRQALIDNDIALIQERARRYTWCDNRADRFSGDPCPGPGGTSIAPGNADYYSVDLNEATNEVCYPSQGTPSNANCTAFRNACVAGQIAAPLRDEITTNIPQTQLDTAGITRTVAVDDADEHRLLITYTSALADAQVVRQLLLVPPVAAWCPV
jgi:Tfp pilus assembly protein PilV